MLDDDGWPVVAPLMKSWGLELQRLRSVVESHLGSRENLGGCDQGGPTPVRDVLWASAGPVDRRKQRPPALMSAADGASRVTRSFPLSCVCDLARTISQVTNPRISSPEKT